MNRLWKGAGVSQTNTFTMTTKTWLFTIGGKKTFDRNHFYFSEMLDLNNFETLLRGNTAI